MKKVYQIIAVLALSVSTVGAFGQAAQHFLMPKGHHGKTMTMSSNTHSILRTQAGPTGVILDWDSADATIWGAAYYHNQGELMNTHYVYPNDTAGGNYNTVNYVTVAFDSMFDAYTQTGYPAPSSIKIDSLYVPFAQVNHSGIDDTLDIKVVKVDGNGYPTATQLMDTMIIGTNIGAGSSSLIAFAVWGPNKVISGKGFAVTLKYMGSKMDSCYFIYGFGSFTNNCTFGSGVVLAQNTFWSTVHESTPFVANSFVLWNQYSSYGTLPDNTGADIYYDCNSDGNYTSGTDGLSYFQNINIYAMVDLDPPSGVNEVASKGFSVGQNYPNPFNNNTEISYNLTKSANVQFTVCDMTGRELVSNNYSTVAPGQHVINLQASQFTPGIYFYTFNVNGNKVTRKMVITQ